MVFKQVIEDQITINATKHNQTVCEKYFNFTLYNPMLRCGLNPI